MAEDNMDVDEDVDIGGPESPLVKRRRPNLKDQFKKTTFLPLAAPSPDDLIIPLKPLDQREKCTLVAKMVFKIFSSRANRRKFGFHDLLLCFRRA